MTHGLGMTARSSKEEASGMWARCALYGFISPRRLSGVPDLWPLNAPGGAKSIGMCVRKESSFSICGVGRVISGLGGGIFFFGGPRRPGGPKRPDADEYARGD